MKATHTMHATSVPMSIRSPSGSLCAYHRPVVSGTTKKNCGWPSLYIRSVTSIAANAPDTSGSRHFQHNPKTRPPPITKAGRLMWSKLSTQFLRGDASPLRNRNMENNLEPRPALNVAEWKVDSPHANKLSAKPTASRAVKEDTNVQLTRRPSSAMNGAKTIGYIFSSTATASRSAAAMGRSACRLASAARHSAATRQSTDP